MSKRAFDKIATGLNEAKDIVSGKTKPRRQHIPLKTQLAAALVQIGEIPFEHAKMMSVDQIIGLFQLDHGIFKTWEENPGEFDKHWNLKFRLIKEHRGKYKADIQKIRKTDRLSEAHQAFRAKLLQPGPIGEVFDNLFQEFQRGRKKPKGKIPSRPFAKGQRKLASRNTLRSRGDATRTAK